jgi:hypothetical protein
MLLGKTVLDENNAQFIGLYHGEQRGGPGDPGRVRAEGIWISLIRMLGLVDSELLLQIPKNV